MRSLSYWWTTLLAVHNCFKPPDMFLWPVLWIGVLHLRLSIYLDYLTTELRQLQCTVIWTHTEADVRAIQKGHTLWRRSWGVFWLRTPLSQSISSSSCVSTSVDFALQPTPYTLSLRYKESRRFLSTMNSLSVIRLICFSFCFRVRMLLDSHHIVIQSLGWMRLTIKLACFRPEPAEPLHKQSVIIRQQNVCRHFVA